MASLLLYFIGGAKQAIISFLTFICQEGNDNEAVATTFCEPYDDIISICFVSFNAVFAQINYSPPLQGNEECNVRGKTSRAETVEGAEGGSRTAEQ